MQRDALPQPVCGSVRWPATLALDATRHGPTTRLHARHHGPLRLLKTLYPEGPAIAHAVLVHPPGGLVGGDRLDLALDVQPGAHLLATTPSATRFYRSVAGDATQAVQARVAAGGRLEWLPQETLAYTGCQARNELRVTLAGDGAALCGELLVLGLPQAGRPFVAGQVLQHLEITGLWRDRGLIKAQDHALLDGPCGLAGHRVLGTLLLAQGEAFAGAWPQALLDDTRALIESSPEVTAGASLLHGRLLLLRLLAHELEPATALLRQARTLWRQQAWGLAPCEPRVWAT
jgi:urease accessory protein